eukprot:702469-Prymnesium_polylepis.1
MTGSPPPSSTLEQGHVFEVQRPPREGEITHQNTQIIPFAVLITAALPSFPARLTKNAIGFASA